MNKLFNISEYLLSVPAILLVITIHSFTKAAVATALGDDLPKKSGRLTLNPFKHVDGIGLLLLFFTGYGWDKPIRTSFIYNKNKKRNNILVNALPILTLLIISAVFIIISNKLDLMTIYMQNNLLNMLIEGFISNVSIYSLSMAVFNMIPIYPMDGSGILKVFLNPNQIIKLSQMEGILQIILMFFIMFGWLNAILYPIINVFFTIFSMI